MISKLYINHDLTIATNAELLEDIDLKKTKMSKLHIPLYMSYIDKGAPKTTIAGILNTNIFVNESNKPRCQNILKERNYVTGRIYNTNEVEDMQSTVDIANKIVKESFKDTSVTPHIKKRTVKYKVKAGTKLRASFLNGKLTKLAYNINTTGSNEAETD